MHNKQFIKITAHDNVQKPSKNTFKGNSIEWLYQINKNNYGDKCHYEYY